MKARCCSRLRTLLAPALFKALGDPNRVALVLRLADADRPHAVSELAPCCTVDLSVVSRHLATLRGAGVVRAERSDKQVLYSLEAHALAGLLRELADALDGTTAGHEDGSRPAAALGGGTAGDEDDAPVQPHDGALPRGKPRAKGDLR